MGNILKMMRKGWKDPEADEESRSRRPRAAATTGGSRRMQDGSCPRVSGGVWSSEGPQPPEL